MSRRVLFVHQGFPGQFVRLAPLCARQGWEVVALGMHAAPPLPGVRYCRYGIPERPRADLDELLTGLDAKRLRALGAGNAARQLRDSGFTPDVIVVHPGWGESLLLREVWPQALQLHYCEFFYHPHGLDTDFDPEFAPPADDWQLNLRFKNATLLLALADMNAGVAPTRFQRQLFPTHLQAAIACIHDGVDTDRLCPDPQAELVLDGEVYRAGEAIITHVNRSLEPMRGIHSFLRALPAIQAARPDARVLIAGMPARGYGVALPAGHADWPSVLQAELQGAVDWSRVRFAGRLDHEQLRRLYQVSAAHVYLSYPFVLSWSVLEAMSCGVRLVASRTAPLAELVLHGENGLLVDFFDTAAIAGSVLSLLAHPEHYDDLRARARQTVVAGYDWQRVCAPRWLALLRRLADSRVAPRSV